MKKNFVFDTNVLLTDPHAVLKFEENNVIIPITVIEEIDKFKRDASSVGRNAREASRLLDGFRTKGELNKGVPLEGGGKLRVMTDLGKEPPLPFPTLGKTADSLILAAALKLKKLEKLPVVFVTRDINLRLRADAVGLTAVNYEEEDMVADIEELYTGRINIEVPGDVVDEFQDEGELDGSKFKLLANQFVKFIDEKNRGHWAMGRYHSKQKLVLPIVGEREAIYGIKPRNDEQRFAVDLLLDDSVRLVTLSGKAGTGKTLLAIAAGVRKVLKDKTYSKLVVARPILPMGKDLGYLPGSLGEKILPWMQPVFDNLELILHSKSTGPAPKSEKGGQKRSKRASKGQPISQDILQLMDKGALEVEALTYIRGRSLPRQFLVIDEAQNLTNHEVKTVITRAGDGTKVVLTGDPHQIDNPFMDARTSGLSVAVEKFKGHEISGHITLVKGERSKLSELASNLL